MEQQDDDAENEETEKILIIDPDSEVCIWTNNKRNKVYIYTHMYIYLNIHKHIYMYIYTLYNILF